MSAKTERLKTPLLFPCAARVKMPQLGSEDSTLKDPLSVKRLAPDTIVFRSAEQPSEPINNDYLRKVSTGLNFEESVVRERCFHALPYDEKYMYENFDLGDLVPLPPRTKIPVGRHNTRGYDVRHMPCNLTKSTKSHLKPLKRRIIERAKQMHFEAAKREEMRNSLLQKLQEQQKALLEKVEETEEEADKEEKPEGKEAEPKQNVFLTEIKPDVTVSEGVTEEVKTDEKRGNDWDAYLLSMLSTNTANWIVYERTPAGSTEREKLQPLLKKWYGDPEHTDLIRDDMSDTEIEEKKEVEKIPKKKWKKKEATLLEKVYDVEDAEPQALDPYSDDNQAPFYRQPAGLRRARKHEEKEELGAINTTAADIVVETFKAPPPPTLRDFINPNVGDTVYETSNMFQQEQLTGTDQVYQAFGDKTKIVMATNNKYKKDVQLEFPQAPEHWFPLTDAEKNLQLSERKKRRKFERGHKRWRKLPEPIDDTAEVLKVLPPGADAEFLKSADPRTRKTAKSNASLMQIIDEWRSKWHLSGQFVDSNPDDLIKDMADIQPHVRLKAVATCAKASDYKPPEDHGIQLEYMDKEESVESLPERLFVALECLLDDPVEKVKKASAITLYALNRPSNRAELVLYDALQSENPVDRWASAQCLAHYGVCDSDVVGEILRQVMTTEDTIKHERGISMLGILSIQSNLVHSMVAEQLNSSSWRHKVIACKILPTLRGDINKDITNKLSDLMWHDWHAEVRRSAAQCLGKTGHGRDVHDDLRNRILEGDERIKLEAINKVGQLGIMTAKLLPAFLKCFEDEYLAVRSEVCITCGNLAIKDEEIVAKLIHLATFDSIWKIKALAFQALGKIGLVTDQIIDCLLWAVRYEENAGVRAEACHTLKVLKVRTEEVAEVLQDRFLVESSPLVRDELAATLGMFDISATEDMDMVAQIKKEVQKLCTRNIIASQITLNEQDSDRRENLKRMIYESSKDMKSETDSETEREKGGGRLYKAHLRQCIETIERRRMGCIRKTFSGTVLTPEHEKEPEPMMERIRSLSQLSLSKTQEVESGPTSPEPIRDIVFTPTADQELEAILGKGDRTKSGVSSPTDTDPTTTPGSKSRTTTPGSQADDEDDDDEEGEDKVDAEAPSTNASATPGKESSEDDLEPEIVKVSTDAERPTSTVKFAAHLEVADIPTRSQSTLGPSRMSLMDDHGKPSRMSAMTGTTGTEGMVFGRDAVLEREKINEEARNTFAVMDLRYQDMVQDLIDLDNAFELGLTSGDSRQQFEERIRSVKVVKTPPSTAGSKAKIELARDEVVAVDKEEVVDDKGKKDGVDREDTEVSQMGLVSEKSNIEIVVTSADENEIIE